MRKRENNRMKEQTFRKRYREVFFTLVLSPSQSSSKQKQGVQSFIWVSHMTLAVLQHSDHLPSSFPGILAGSWIRHGAGTPTVTPVRDDDVVGGGFPLCSPGPV